MAGRHVIVLVELMVAVLRGCVLGVGIIRASVDPRLREAKACAARVDPRPLHPPRGQSGMFVGAVTFVGELVLPPPEPCECPGARHGVEGGA